MNHQATPISADELQRLREVEVRFNAMLPLFEEARDALPAISETSRMLRGISPSLADRMDDVGIAERWKAMRAQPFYHNDKPSERTDLHISTGPSDLDCAGRPLRAGS